VIGNVSGQRRILAVKASQPPGGHQDSSLRPAVAATSQVRDAAWIAVAFSHHEMMQREFTTWLATLLSKSLRRTRRFGCGLLALPRSRGSTRAPAGRTRGEGRMGETASMPLNRGGILRVAVPCAIRPVRDASLAAHGTPASLASNLMDKTVTASPSTLYCHKCCPGHQTHWRCMGGQICVQSGAP
jgi:hypothetical protein